jgi:predicted enzyme related to lactoylglutathione lyase
MPARPAAPAGTPVWIDLFSSDTAQAEQFYGAVLGWEAQHTGPDFGGYVNFTRNGAMVAGMMHNDGTAGTPDMWNTYLSVPDAKATTEAARAAGGQVHMEAMQVMDLGTMGMVADTGGAAIGLWQPAAHVGYQIFGEHGAPCWHELHTRHYDAVLDFYRATFGWTTQVMSDSGDFRYTQVMVDGEAYAGVMDSSAFLPEGMPSTWQIYFGAVDVDATVAQVVELGGQVVQPAEDSPFGRMAGVTDPTGAFFKLVSVPS